MAYHKHEGLSGKTCCDHSDMYACEYASLSLQHGVTRHDSDKGVSAQVSLPTVITVGLAKQALVLDLYNHQNGPVTASIGCESRSTL